MVEIKTILFPIDLTQDSSKVLPYVLSASEKYNSTIYLLHVIQDVYQWAPGYVAQPSAGVLRKEAQECCKKDMEKFCEEQLQGYPYFQTSVVLGNPVGEILKAIESQGIDLVIMGTHGRKGLKHVIFGSVAENVVKRSPVPVLTINPYKVR
ncbi:MAG: universal stress protein [Deltaproteobacteria bacterium]|nr:universal stress protein [Deltaproteobacteria bacterium]